ncbi:eukaryotic translation initiation factor 3 subunit A-like isoform X2 [Rhynchophorus ferrugineus]|uniref:eukaryotic translation initiation factor 3 subunit A-like isoform X2 n=1 Tax=Rhynchophorus ferrugineus TaxID=354439 RepID=UPI003FCD04AA
MPRYHPETVLKYANDLIERGQDKKALDTLQQVFLNKKYNYNWSEIMEPLMMLYLNLCFELNQLDCAKEGLVKYHKLVRFVNVTSLEKVMMAYLRAADSKVKGPLKQAARTIMPEMEVRSSAESDGDDINFLYRSYILCLRLLKCNQHVEDLYHQVARMALQFCLEYDGRRELKNIGDILTQDFKDVCDAPIKLDNVSMFRLVTQRLHIQTCLRRLQVATQMQLWPEAYKTIKDMNYIKRMSEEKLSFEAMDEYYEQVVTIFWYTGNYVFHASALLKWLQVNKEQEFIAQDKLRALASRVLLATLAIPLLPDRPAFGRFIEDVKSPLKKAREMTVHLGLKKVPTRNNLLQDLIRIDHGKQCIHFDVEFGEDRQEGELSDSYFHLIPNGGQIRYRLSEIATVLGQAVAVICHNKNKEENERTRNSMVMNYHKNALEERNRFHQRPKIVENSQRIRMENRMRIDEIQRALLLFGQNRPDRLKGVEQIIDRNFAGDVEEDEYSVKLKQILRIISEERIKLLNISLAKEKGNVVRYHNAELKKEQKRILLKGRRQEKERNANEKRFTKGRPRAKDRPRRKNKLQKCLAQYDNDKNAE